LSFTCAHPNDFQSQIKILDKCHNYYYTLTGIISIEVIFFIPDKVYFIKFHYIYTHWGIKMNASLARFIKEKRRLLKLTQPELAERAGVGLRFVRELEQGKQTVQLDKVNLVLALFGSELGVVPKTES
jgi:y4mF family transcriptional regulator